MNSAHMGRTAPTVNPVPPSTAGLEDLFGTPSPLHQAALNYAKQGIPVFPCVVNGKMPACGEGGFHRATTDIAQINAWWTAQPDCNIGCEPGRIGRVVADLDTKNGAKGVANWEALCEAAGTPRPRTRTVKTPSGGLHLWFQGDGGSTAGKLAPGIDTRGRNGYVLLPPSRIEGNEYELIADVTSAPLPAFVADKLLEYAAGDRSGRKAPEHVEFDSPETMAWAIAYITNDVTTYGEPEQDVGKASDYRTFCIIGDLLDGPEPGQSLERETIAALLKEYWQPKFDLDWYVLKLENHSYQNEAGCGPATFIRPASVLHAEGAKNFGREPWDAPTQGKKVIIASAADVEPEPVEWLWHEWLPRGMFVVMAGSKGDGKSTIVYNWLARMTIGGYWPDGSPAPVGSVLVWSGEDDFKRTILPRFLAAGGDKSKLHYIPGVSDGQRKRRFDPATDTQALCEAAAAIPDLLAISIDPVVMAVSGDDHSNSAVRRGLDPLVDLAEQRGALLIGITHFTKGTVGRNPIERVTGSLAFGALPRVVYGTQKLDDDGKRRRLVRIESNIGPSGDGFDYGLTQERIRPELFAQSVRWDGMVRGSARALLGNQQEANKTEAAMTFLRDLLKDGPVAVKAIQAAAEADGHSWATIKQQAKPRLNLVSKRGEALQQEGKLRNEFSAAALAGWYWLLPEPEEGDNPGEPGQGEGDKAAPVEW